MSDPIKNKAFKKSEEDLPINSPSLKKVKKKKDIAKKTSKGIPKEIANRMGRRVLITTGIPTISGMGVFIGSYILVSKGIAEIPPGITLLTSAICFLIGLVGLSYGILSASWDNPSGSILGIENIGPNIQRVKSAFKAKD